MASGIDTSTKDRFVLNPALIYLNGRLMGPTRGGVDLQIARDFVQPEMDGVNQGIVGAKYIRSNVATLTFDVVEFGVQNLLAANFFTAGTGTTPNFTYAQPANMTMLASGLYLPGALTLYAPFTDATTPGFIFVTIATGLFTAAPAFGASGEATLKCTCVSEALAGAPDSVPWSWGRVATIPAEVGGP